MPVIEWNDDFRTGISKIDSEHRFLFGLVNRLYDKHVANSSEEVILDTIETLIEYVNTHFEGEEALMKSCGYVQFETHVKSHQKLRDRVTAFRKSYGRDPASFDMEEFINFLSDWLNNHIIKADMNYVPYLKDNVENSPKT